MNIQQAGSQKIFELQEQTNVVSVGRGWRQEVSIEEKACVVNFHHLMQAFSRDTLHRDERCQLKSQI